MNGHLSLKCKLVTSKRLCIRRRYRVFVRVSTPSSSTASGTAFALPATGGGSATLLLVGLSEIKASHVHHSCVSAHSLAASMFTQVMSLEIHFRFEHDKLLLHTFTVVTEEMILLEVLFECVVVEVVVGVSRLSTIANKATFVLHATVLIEAIVIVKSLATEATQRVTFEAGLISRAGFVVAAAHVLFQLLIRKQFMLVGEDLFVACAEIAHALSMDALDMAVQVWPTQAGEIARGIRAIVSKKQNCVTHNVFVCVLDANVSVGCRGIFVRVFFESLLGVVGEDDKWSSSLEYVRIWSPILKSCELLTRQ